MEKEKSFASIIPPLLSPLSLERKLYRRGFFFLFWKLPGRCCVQLVRTILASCVRFDVVPRLLIGAQRSIELQASGVGLFTPYRQPLTFHRSLPLSVDYLLLFLVTSQPSTLCLLVSLFRYLRYIYNVYVCVCVCVYIYIYIRIDISRSLVPSQWRGLHYPNSISVQLRFIPVSKRQSRCVHLWRAVVKNERLSPSCSSSQSPSWPTIFRWRMLDSYRSIRRNVHRRR